MPMALQAIMLHRTDSAFVGKINLDVVALILNPVKVLSRVLPSTLSYQKLTSGDEHIPFRGKPLRFKVENEDVFGALGSDRIDTIRSLCVEKILRHFRPFKDGGECLEIGHCDQKLPVDASNYEYGKEDRIWKNFAAGKIIIHLTIQETVAVDGANHCEYRQVQQYPIRRKPVTNLISYQIVQYQTKQ